MIPDDLKWFKPSEQETPAVVRIMDAMAFVAAAGLGCRNSMTSREQIRVVNG